MKFGILCDCYCRTASGTFQDGDLMLNQKGLRLISEENDSIVSFAFGFLIFCFESLISLNWSISRIYEKHTHIVQNKRWFWAQS